MAIINIIGNGFDRSHNLKTSYGNFIEYLINESINYNRDIRDNLFDVGKLPSENQSYEEIKINFQKFVNNRQIEFKNNFLRILIDKFFEANWIEIEEYYFEVVKDIKPENSNYLQTLNSEFNQVKDYLEKYLNIIQTDSVDAYNEEYLRLFYDVKHSDNLFLNFNYTNTLDKYLEELKVKNRSFKFDINHIHGKLFDQENPVVFGFGDENSDYLRMRNYSNEYTKYHKTHIYPKKENKQLLLNYLSTRRDIQVNIFGHSCGISDRVILKKIFQHQNVNKIKIYYYLHQEEDNFQDISSNIFKTVSTNAILDEKLLSMPSCKPMPQIISNS